MNFLKRFFNGTEKESTKQLSNNRHDKPIQVLTAFDVAERLATDRRKLEQSFIGLGWTEKTSKGMIATQDGITNGARTKYHEMNGNKYVVWDESILKNQTLHEFLNRTT